MKSWFNLIFIVVFFIVLSRMFKDMQELSRQKIPSRKEALMFSGIPAVVFVVVALIGGIITAGLYAANAVVGTISGIISFFTAVLLSSAVKVAAQWERAVQLRLGKYIGIKGPGIFFIVPIIDNVTFVDTRILTLDVLKQQVITKDNVPVSINGVVYFKVANTADAIIKV